MMTGIFSTLLLPETKGLTLEELSNEDQDEFVKRKTWLYLHFPLPSHLHVIDYDNLLMSPMQIKSRMHVCKVMRCEIYLSSKWGSFFTQMLNLIGCRSVYISVGPCGAPFLSFNLARPYTWTCLFVQLSISNLERRPCHRRFQCCI